jgi:hypothetical protein
MPFQALADNLIYRYEGGVLPQDAGWLAVGCEPPCYEVLVDGHFVLVWDTGSQLISYYYVIARPGDPPPPPAPFWVEWAFRSDTPFNFRNEGCDAGFQVSYMEVFDLLSLLGDAVSSFSGDDIWFGLPLYEFRTFRFESPDGVNYCFFVDGRTFLCATDHQGNGYHYLIMTGVGLCDVAELPTVNEWDFVRYGTIEYGEQIVASDPPAGFVDARESPMVDRFNVTYDSPNYVYIDEISVEVAALATEPLSHEATQGPEGQNDETSKSQNNTADDSFSIPTSAFVIPVVVATRRLDNGPPETVEIVLDRPIPYNATTRFTFNDGVAVNVVEFTFAPGDTDGDGDADLSDFAAFQNCFGNSPVAGVCLPLNFNSDQSIDLTDYAEFQAIFRAP